jgi:YVTN family beta-propeller protein
VVNTITIPGGEVGYGFLGTMIEPIILSPDGSTLYVGYIGTGSTSIATGLGNIDVINTATYRITNTISLGGAYTTPGQLAITPDGKQLYVAGDDWASPPNIKVINTATNKISNTISCALGACDSVLITPDGKSAYVISLPLDGPDNVITVINTSTNRVTNTIYGPKGAYYQYYMAATPDSKYLYVSDDSKGTVDVINIATNKITNSIALPQNYPEFIEIGSGGIADVLDSGLSTYAVAINTATNNVISTTAAPGGYMMAISPDGTYAYVADTYADDHSPVIGLTLVNVLSGNAVTVPLGSRPIFITAVQNP